MKFRIFPFDFIIILLILFISFFLINKYKFSQTDKVIVQSNGKQYEYSLDKQGILSVNGALGETTFEIKNHQVRILSSPCPNKTCIASGWGNTVICLPNKVSIYIIESSENIKKKDKEIQLDAISQ